MRGNFIDGIWRPVQSADDVYIRKNPARLSETLYEMPWATAAVDEAVHSASRAQASWDRLGREGRLVYLERFSKELEKRSEALARAISEEAGKPLWEARGEANALMAKISIMTGEGGELTAPHHPDGLDGGHWEYRPLGVIAVLGPFNFPLHLPNGHIIPALYNGNTVVIKPSELTSRCMEIYLEAAEEAEFPSGVLNLVEGPGEVGAALVEHRDVDGIAFTGSYETGLRIKRATLEHHWKLLALEMGGKNTSIVLEDADLEQTINEILYAAFMTAGQRCSATSRVVVREEIFDEFCARFAAQAERVTTGDPIDETCFMGPLVDEKAFKKFLAAQEETESGNLEPILRGGRARDDLDGYYVSPAVWKVDEFDPAGAHQATEIFGPDVVVYSAANDPRAARIANGTDFGLAMSIFTADEARFEALAQPLRAGIVNMNRSTCGASSRLPFGGVKKSGNHRPSAVTAGLYVTYPQAQLRQAAGWDASKNESAPWSLLKS